MRAITGAIITLAGANLWGLAVPSLTLSRGSLLPLNKQPVFWAMLAGIVLAICGIVVAGLGLLGRASDSTK